jgi:hypothetical protein
VLNEVVLNQVLVSFGEPEVTNRIIAEIQADGTCWCGGTVWQSQTAMRISVASWATTDADVERSIEAVLRIAGKQLRRDTAHLQVVPAGQDHKRELAAMPGEGAQRVLMQKE